MPLSAPPQSPDPTAFDNARAPAPGSSSPSRRKAPFPQRSRPLEDPRAIEAAVPVGIWVRAPTNGVDPVDTQRIRCPLLNALTAVTSRNAAPAPGPTVARNEPALKSYLFSNP